MIKEDKNKIRLNTKSKILVLGIILVVLIGLFSSVNTAWAQNASPTPGQTPGVTPVTASQPCTGTDAASGTPTPTGCTPTTDTTTEEKTDQKTALENELKNCTNFIKGDFDGCIEKIFYIIFYGIPSLLLYLSGHFFNALVALGLNSDLLKSTFVSSAWGIVRDLSNIFFILILLFLAIQIILGMGGHDVKKMIAKVVVMALLINFSMFFTGIVIDSSNVLALVFYNKLKVEATVGGNINNYIPVTSTPGEKDISGGMITAFDVSKFMGQPFFEELKKRQTTISGPSASQVIGGITFAVVTGGGSLINPIKAVFYPSKEIPLPTILALILITGVIMLFASYCFLVAGFSFLGRLIELWILIIFSPFAFMSFSVPFLKDKEYIGWDAWFSRLLTVSFMAPIFMFFMYFIFLLINSNIFTGMITPAGSQTVAAMLLLIILPAMFILILLLKATEFAKKGSGKFGEIVMSGAKMLGGIAIAAASGGTAMALQGTLGANAQRIANNDKLKAQASGDEKHYADYFALKNIKNPEEQKRVKAQMQIEAQRKLAAANKTASRSFDIRDTGLGKFAAKQTGMNFEKGTGFIGMDIKGLKGGVKEKFEQSKEKAIKTQESYKMSGAAADEQDDLAKKAEKQNARAKQYREDLEEAKKMGTVFNEKSEQLFKEAYEHGDDLRKFKLDKKVEEGPIQMVATLKTSVEINNERKDAYILSLKEKGVNPEIIAAVRKGEDKDKKLLKMIKEAQAGGHKEEGKDHKKTGSDHGGSAPKPSAPAGGGGDHPPAAAPH